MLCIQGSQGFPFRGWTLHIFHRKKKRDREFRRLAQHCSIQKAKPKSHESPALPLTLILSTNLAVALCYLQITLLLFSLFWPFLASPHRNQPLPKMNLFWLWDGEDPFLHLVIKINEYSLKVKSWTHLGGMFSGLLDQSDTQSALFFKTSNSFSPSTASSSDWKTQGTNLVTLN